MRLSIVLFQTVLRVKMGNLSIPFKHGGIFVIKLLGKIYLQILLGNIVFQVRIVDLHLVCSVEGFKTK